jgi:hypothetical protein
MRVRTRQRHLIDTAGSGNGLTESFADVRVAGPAIGYVFSSSDGSSTSVILEVARTSGAREASEAVGQVGEDARPGDDGPVVSSELGAWAVDADGDLLWSQGTTGADGRQETELRGLAGAVPGPVDPVTLGVGGPFTRLVLDGARASWATPGATGRIDLRAATTLRRPRRQLATCDLLTPVETLAALGATELPTPVGRQASATTRPTGLPST